MGIKQTDLVPFNVTAITPPSKSIKMKAFQVTRTDLVSSVKAIIPAGASLLGVDLMVTTASNAGTTATVTISVTQGVNTSVLINAANVKNLGTTSVKLLTIQDLPTAGDLLINAVYAETGTASTTGGPFYAVVSFVE